MTTYCGVVYGEVSHVAYLSTLKLIDKIYREVPSGNMFISLWTIQQ